MKVDILGTKYDVLRVDVKQDKIIEKMNYGGYCDGTNKKIVILNLKSTTEWKNESDQCIRKQENETLRHEIIHAFFNESGLQWSSFIPDKAWTKNEEMVDWFAIQFPKILKAFKEAGCLG